MEQNLTQLESSIYPIDWYFVKDGTLVNIFSAAKDFNALEELNSKLDRPFTKLELVFMHIWALFADVTTRPQAVAVFKDTFRKFADLDSIQNVKELRDRYVEWKTNVTTLAQEDSIKVRNLRAANSQLDSVPPVVSYGYRKIASGFVLKVPIDTKQDILPDYFAAIKTSYFAPFVKYTDTRGLSKFKIYKGNLEELRPSYKVAIPSKLTERNDCIFMYIWKMPYADKKYRSYRNVQEARIEDFSVVTITQEQNAVVITCDNTNNQNLIISRIIDSIPSMNLKDIGHIEETGITVENYFYLNIPGGTLPVETLHMQIMLTPFINQFFYLDESARGRAVAVQHKYFSGKGFFQDANIPIGKQVAENIFSTPDSVIFKASIEADTPEDARSYIQTMRHVLGFISGTYVTAQNVLYAFVPELFKPKSTILIPILRNGNYTAYEDKNFTEIYGISKVKLLQSVGGDLFKGNYSRSCQRERQPVPVSYEEAQLWQQKEVLNSKTLVPQTHEVVMYPEPEDLVNPEDISKYPPQLYACPSPDSPFIVRKPNATRSAATLNVRNFLCCATGTATGDTKTSETILQTYKIAKPGQLGIINIYLEDGLYRQGTIHSNNSALHCLNSIVIKDYYSMPLAEMNELIQRQKLNLLSFRFAMKQQQYDRTTASLRKELESDDFLDPFIWIRGLEEMYNLNIFVFHKKYLQRGGKTIAKLMVPRHKYFYVPYFDPNRLTVMLFKHYGAEINNLDSPQCELIVRGQGAENLFTFNDPLVNKLRNAMDYISGVISWDSRDTELVTRKNYFTSIKPALFRAQEEFNITGQFIDTNGKLRMFIVNNKWSIVIPPSAPLNVPIITSLVYPTRQEVDRVFGVGKYAKAGSRNGYWYDSGDTPNAVFILFEADEEKVEYVDDDPEELKEIDELQIPAFLVTKDTTLIHAKKLKRQAQILMQMICYLFLSLPVDQRHTFMINYTTVNHVDYEISKVPRIMPRLPFSELMTWVSQVSNLVQDGKVQISSNKFYATIVNQLDKMSAYTDIDDYSVLRGYYTELYDYSSQPELEYVLSGMEEFSNWETFVVKGDVYITEIKNIKATQEPILYNQGDKFFILQNVSSKTIEQALGVAVVWHEQKINAGFFSKRYVEKPQVGYGEYETDRNGHLVYISQDDQNTQPINVLYFEGTYVALLKLH